MADVAERLSSYAAAFEAFRAEAAFGAGRLRELRADAMARFLDGGLPTTREEEWRHTSLAPLAALAFERAGEAAVDRTAIAPFLFDAAAVPCQIVVVNGRLAPALSALDRIPAGVTVRGLRAAAEAGEAWALDALATPDGATPFVDLNTALFEDGLVVEVAAKAVVESPIHVLFVTSAGAPALVAPRLSIVLGEQAQATLVESYAGLNAAATLVTPVTRVAVGASARLEHVKLQREPADAFHLAGTFVEVARAGVFASRAITLGSRIGRNDIAARLAGEGAECTLDGVYIADGDTLVDTHTTIDHAEPHCPSHEVYKGILGGRARAVFNGKIIVRQKAQKTDAKQTNKALLLTDDAVINTKPQLEIFADDVRCTHGAAIGQLDEDALFYLRSRGVAAKDARNMLIHAFAGEVLDGITIEAVRDRTLQLIDEKLHLT